MKAKTNELFEDFSGSTGGITASHSAGHLVVRSKVIPTYTDTEYQKAVRQNFTTYTKKWGELTDEQRRKWIDKAREASANKTYFGISGKISGFNLYVKCNINLKLINAPIELHEPVRDMPKTTPLIENIEVTGAGINIELSDIVHIDDAVVIRATPLKAGQSTNTNGLRQVGIIIGGSQMTDITAKFREMFGEPISGEKIQVQAYSINKNSGYASVRQVALSNIIP